MNGIKKRFLKKSEDKAFSLQHRRTIQFNMGKYDIKVSEGKLLFKDLAAARAKASEIKSWSVQNLHLLLTRFEEKMKERGTQVLWAKDTASALKIMEEIVARHQIKTVVKSKSMITEELHLNPFLEQQGVEVLETDLGEYIVQLRDEAPYHIVTPAMHLSKEEIALLFHEKFNLDKDASPELITAFVRKLLREKFEKADLGITGANFLIANQGLVAITENEGNARMSFSYPKVHVAIAGIEKVIPDMSHLSLFWPLLATYGTGQHLTVYNSLVAGPRRAGESQGPEHMYLILLDNGRTNLLSDEKEQYALHCIRCGSCLNACPVYRTIGGHTYESAYGGPIGAVLMPALHQHQQYSHLSEASSLCGACTENCPVNIPLHTLLLHNRNKARQTDSQLLPKTMWTAWEKAMLDPKWIDFAPTVKNWMFQVFFSKYWGKRRKLPQMQAKSFRKLWKEGRV